MGLFKRNNNCKEVDEVSTFCKEMLKLLQQDKYISKTDYIEMYDECLQVFNDFILMKNKGLLKAWCKKNKVNYKPLEDCLNQHENIEKLVSKHNDDFINEHLKIDKEYLDNVLVKDDPNIILDEEQRRAILSDEDYTLVVAGAGAGKTTTIEGKVIYLVEKQKVDPNRILIVSFTKKATEELKGRFKRLGVNVNISTFHSIGNTIIKNNESIRHRIVSSGFMFDRIKEYLITKLDDEYFIKKILLFFASYLTMPFDEKDTSLLYKTLMNNDIKTLKSDLEGIIQEFSDTQSKQKITINNERVRSIDECRIANYLYINGIDYIYEPVYQYGFKDTIKPYCPDFVINQNGNKIYLEHFGISQDGKNSRFTSEELQKYKEHINDKVRLHKEHETKLIYTFSKYNDNRDLIEHLHDELVKASVELNTRNNMEVYKKIITNAEDKYFNKFIILLCNFISKFKTNNFTASKFDEWKIVIKDERTKLFLDIAYQCYLVYTKALKDTNSIDFEDMINDASNILDKKIAANEMLEYDYVFVDEYQDISMQRFDLCKKLSQASRAKIIVVGDDWQSIFRFSGSQVDLFTNFKESMGYANILKITNTYRNSQELIDVAGKFVMKNEQQIKKTLKSNKSVSDPIILMSYNDSFEKDENNHSAFYRLGKTIEKALDKIVLECGDETKVLFIGRYGFDGQQLSTLEELFTYHNNKIQSIKYPNLKIDFLTAHSSKGLGYENVIIINAKDAILGFPSQIDDDSVMRLVIKDNEKIDYAEERRLFYVALTRTKNKVYIITPQHKPSKFVLEIKDQNKNVIIDGENLTPTSDTVLKVKCPVCGYPLQKRKSNFKFNKEMNTLWICSNDPEVCGFLTNDLQGGKLSISKCPDCEDGYLIVKPIKNSLGINTNRRMLGCTNYKKDGTGCNGHIMDFNYTQDKNKLAIAFLNSDSSVDKLIYMGYPIKELINKILHIIKNGETQKHFKFNITSLKDYLCGNMSNAISKFKLNETKDFGCIKIEHQRKITPLLNELIREEILTCDKDNYNSLTINIKEIDDEGLKNLFANLIK